MNICEVCGALGATGSPSSFLPCSYLKCDKCRKEKIMPKLELLTVFGEEPKNLSMYSDKNNVPYWPKFLAASLKFHLGDICLETIG